MPSNGGQENARALGQAEGKLEFAIRWLEDHETRLRKIEARMRRGAILAALGISGIATNAKPEQIADLVVQLLKAGG